MNPNKKAPVRDLKPHLPSLETIQQELGKAQSVDDFFGKLYLTPMSRPRNDENKVERKATTT